jgi:hypothetical protein
MMLKIFSDRDYELAHPAPSVSRIDQSRETGHNEASDTFSFLFLFLIIALFISVCFSKSKVFGILLFICNLN